jgi:hypothetical protein
MSPASWEEMVEPAQEYLQKGIGWLFRREAEEVPEGAEDEAVQPFKPSPLRFLRGKKTAPVAAAPYDSASSLSSDRPRGSSSSSSDDPANPSAGVHTGWAAGAAAAAPASSQPLAQPPVVLSLVPLAAEHPAGGSPTQSNHGEEDLEAGRGATHATATATAQLGVGPSAPGAVQQLASFGGSAKGCDPGLPSSLTKKGGCKPVLVVGCGWGLWPVLCCPAGNVDAPFSRSFLHGTWHPLLLLACASHHPHSPTPSLCPAGRPGAVVRTRTQPKTFFANERTFLQWLQIRWGPASATDGAIGWVGGWVPQEGRLGEG